MWVVYALLSAFMAALVAIFAKIGIQNVDSTLATTLRSMIMSTLLVAVSLSLKKFEGFSFSSLESREWLFIVLAGVAGALSWVFYFYALKIGLTSHVVVIDRLSVVFALLLAVIVLGEPLGWKAAIGALLMVGGAVIIAV